MQWLMVARLNRPEILTGGPTKEELRQLEAHFVYWQRLTEEGIALVVGRTQTTDPSTMRLAIYRADDAATANSIAATDPAVANGVFTSEVRPYAVALLGDPEPFRPAV